LKVTNGALVAPFLLVLGLVAGAPALAQPAASDEAILQRASLVAEGDRVALYQDGVSVPSAFLYVAEEACRKLEALTGRKLDTATLGPKIRIYVSRAVAVSHVWRGYDHPRDPRGIVFLNLRAYEGAMRGGGNATYVHELAHLYMRPRIWKASTRPFSAPAGKNSFAWRLGGSRSVVTFPP